MSYFDIILAKREITRSDFNFLWELRLTDREYSELKKALREDAQDRRFSDIKAAALYFAEWWRREFTGGYVGTDDPCRTLLDNIDLHERLYDAAKRGANTLDLQIITTKGEVREVRNNMYSLFYQGGLPMNYIVHEILSNANNGWNTFVKQLVWNQQNFNDVSGLGEIASNSDSMKCFCERLRLAADSYNQTLQPYYHNELWWNVVVRQFEESKRERKARTPFETSWVFKFDDRANGIKIGAKVTGQSKLSDEFVKENGLENNALNFTTISILVNDRTIYTAEYNQKFFCRKTPKIKFQYNIGDTITISLNDGQKILSKKELDFETPRLLFCKDDDETIFYLGEPQNLKDKKCRIIASEEWASDCNYLDEGTIYNIGDNIVRVYNVTTMDSVVTLRNGDEIRRFDPTRGSLKTFVDYKGALKLAIPTKEQVFNVSYNFPFYVGSDERTQRFVEAFDIYYSPKGERQWTQKPMLGEIRVRIKEDEEFSEPIHIINSGKLEFNVISSSRDECCLNIQWEFGDVESNNAIRDGENWIIAREDLINNRYCVFTFKPRVGLGTKFNLNLIPPFHDFCIFDPNDNRMANGSVIPLVEINNFRYYIKNDDAYRLIFIGDRDNYFEYNNDPDSQGSTVSEVLCRQIMGQRQISYEGPLGSFFLRGSEQIEERINSSCSPLPKTSVRISIEQHDGLKRKYTIKPFPLRLNCKENVVSITNVTPNLSYNGKILALPFEEPSLTPVELTWDEDSNGYLIPSEMFDSPYDHWLVFGNRQGYILPTSVKTANSEIQEENDGDDDKLNTRESSRGDKLAEIQNRLLEESMFSESWEKAIKWYKMLPQGYIPGTSILELVGIADNWSLPVKLALHLWIEALCSTSQTVESIEQLESSLLDFSKQMSFIWDWCIDYSDDELNQLAKELFGNGKYSLEQCYYGWILTQPANILQSNPALITPDSSRLLMAFRDWIDNLRPESRPIQNLTDPDINNHGDGLDSEEAKEYFNNLINTNKNIARLPLNDRWVTIRHNINEMFKAINFGFIPGDENIKKEIRQSVINGLRYKSQAQIEEEERIFRGRGRRRNS